MRQLFDWRLLSVTHPTVMASHLTVSEVWLKASISSTLFRWMSTLSPLCCCSPTSDFVVGNWQKFFPLLLLFVLFLSAVEEMTFYSAVLSFYTAPIRHSTSRQRNSARTQMSPRWHSLKGFKVSAALPPRWLQCEVLLWVKWPGTLLKKIIFHTFIFGHSCAGACVDDTQTAASLSARRNYPSLKEPRSIYTHWVTKPGQVTADR